MTPWVETRASWLAVFCATHRWPSAPAAMPTGPELAVVRVNRVACPAGVMRPTLLSAWPVNHRLPSGPAVMRVGALPRPVAKVLTEPAVVIRPRDVPLPVNHRAPSGPATRSSGAVTEPD